MRVMEEYKIWNKKEGRVTLRETCSGRLRCPTTMRWTVSLLFEWGSNGKGFDWNLCILFWLECSQLYLDLFFAARVPPDATRPDKRLCFLSGWHLAASFASSFFLHFCIYIHHTRPDPITKRISAVPPSKWRDVSYICRAEALITDRPTTYVPLNRRREACGLVERGWDRN